MCGLIKFEYKKLWNKVSIVTVIALCILSSLHTFIYLNIQWRTVDQDGEVVNGLGAYRVLLEASKDIEGAMDEAYLKNLVEKYEASIDKQYMDEHRGFLGTGGMTKYMFPNYFINYAYYGQYMSNGNDKIGLDYEFLSSEEQFYQKYGEAALEHILFENEFAGITKFTEQQKEVLEEKIAGLQTPFKVAYWHGLSNFMNWYNIEYPVFFVALAFMLACVYAKDSFSGINELVLSSGNGRKEDFMARCIAGNLFMATVYLVFVGVLVTEHGAIASPHGWQASAQTYWYNCIYNISIGSGILLKLAGGLLGGLVVGNLIMLISMAIKNVRITSIISVVFIIVLINASSTYSQIKLLFPLQFSSDAVVTDFFVIGDILMPYYILIVFLTIIYVSVIIWLMQLSIKRYYLN